MGEERRALIFVCVVVGMVVELRAASDASMHAMNGTSVLYGGGRPNDQGAWRNHEIKAVAIQTEILTTQAAIVSAKVEGEGEVSINQEVSRPETRNSTPSV